MQQSLLQQAEAIWQSQHDTMASELAQAQESRDSALAEVQAQQSVALEAVQVGPCSHTYEVLML